MSFVKGQPRSPNAGRKKGSLNKRTILRVEEVLAARGLNPTEEILKLLPSLPASEAVKTWENFQKYLQAHAKPSEAPAEHDLEINPAIEMSSEELRKVLS